MKFLNLAINHRIPAGPKIVLLTLAAIRDNGGMDPVIISHSQLAEMCFSTTVSVAKHIAYLERKGLLKVERSGKGGNLKINKYDLSPLEK